MRKDRKKNTAGIILLVLVLAISSVSCGKKEKVYGISREEAEALRETALFEEILACREDYPDVYVEALENNPELLNFVSDYGKTAPASSGGLTDAERRERCPLFLQWDRRWGHVPYGSSVIGLCGCGPVCLSMVIFSLTRNENAKPDVLAGAAMEGGYYISGRGTDWRFLTEAAKDFGLLADPDWMNEKRMREVLEEGGLIILSMGPGDFSRDGHFIVVRGCGKEGFDVLDPYRRVNCGTWDYETLSTQALHMWAYCLPAS